MSQPQRAHASSLATFGHRAESADESSGVHRIVGSLADARRSWEEEDLRDEAAEAAIFEWQMFLDEMATAPHEDVIATAAIEAPETRDGGELFTPSEEDEERAWTEGEPRRARVRAVGRLLVAGAFLGMLGIAAIPAGSDVLASWLTMGHRDQARTQVAEMTQRVADLAR